jgi:chromosome segregation ATPase
MRMHLWALAALAAAVPLSGCGSGGHQDEAGAAIASARARIAAEQRAARAQIADDRAAALEDTKTELLAARTMLRTVRRQLAAARVRRTTARSEAEAAERTLARLRAQVGATRATIARGTIDGEGLTPP